VFVGLRSVRIGYQLPLLLFLLSQICLPPAVDMAISLRHPETFISVSFPVHLQFMRTGCKRISIPCFIKFLMQLSLRTDHSDLIF
jgi:hypothetical protein